MKRIRTVNPLAALLLAATAVLAVTVLNTGDSQASEARAQPAVRWEYALIRLQGVDQGARDAAIAQLNRYGRNGWEAVELLPPAYDILMKRPVETGGSAPPRGGDSAGRE